MLRALDSYHCATLLTTPYCGDRVLIVCIIRWVDSQACVLHQLLAENRFQSVAMIICPDSLVFKWYETLCEYTNLKVGVFSSWRYPFLNKRSDNSHQRRFQMVSYIGNSRRAKATEFNIFIISNQAFRSRTRDDNDNFRLLNFSCLIFDNFSYFFLGGIVNE